METPVTTENLTSDSSIIRKILNGSPDLFELLIRRYNSVLYKIGRSYGMSHDDVQDLMQDTHIAAYQNLVKFEERSSYKTWLIQIMLNKCNDWNRKAATRAKAADKTTQDTFKNQTANSDLRREVLNRELGSVLEICIEDLPEKYRTVFVLRELEGLNVPETAQAVMITESNVKIRLKRAKTMLRKQLESWYPQASVYEFNLVYCDRIVEGVLGKILDRTA